MRPPSRPPDPKRPPGRAPARGQPRWRKEAGAGALASGTDGIVLYGWHPVAMALRNPARKIRRLRVTENALRRLQDEGLALPGEVEVMRPDALRKLLPPGAVHQGLLAEAEPLPEREIETLAPEGLVLVLDQITDPHNVGAILRSAAAFAVRAVITTARHSPNATGVLAKAASGALELVPIVTVSNLARGLQALRECGFLLVGLDSTGEHDLTQTPLREPLALVLGAEGKGLRHLTRETCDAVARLDLPGEIKSLNVSNAAALAMYIAATATAASKKNGVA